MDIFHTDRKQRTVWVRNTHRWKLNEAEHGEKFVRKVQAAMDV